MKKRVLILGLATLLSATLLSADCGKGEKKGECQGEKGCGSSPKGMMFEGIELTQKQKDAMLKLTQEQREKNYEHKKGCKAGNDMESYIKDGKFDKATFIKEHTKMASEKATMKADMFEKMYNVLTPAQKEQLSKQQSKNAKN